MTRMWGVDPRLLCADHLLGEHAEMHQEVGAIRAGNMASVRGHATAGQLDTALLQSRHDALARELVRRGYTHDSPLDYDDDLDIGSINVSRNRAELRERCKDCRKRIQSKKTRPPTRDTLTACPECDSARIYVASITESGATMYRCHNDECAAAFETPVVRESKLNGDGTPTHGIARTLALMEVDEA